MPSGTSFPIGRPSNSILPSVAGRSPAISSSSVDLPQPDGPTTAKNSPCRMSRSIGRERLHRLAARAGGEALGDPAQRDVGRGLPAAVPSITSASSGRRAGIGVDDLRRDRRRRRARRRSLCTSMIRFMPSRWKLAVCPSTGPPACQARRQVAHGAARDFGRDVEWLGDDVAGLVGMRDHELDGAAPRADDGTDEIAARSSSRRPVAMPTTLSSGGSASAPVISTRYLSFDLGP